MQVNVKNMIFHIDFQIVNYIPELNQPKKENGRGRKFSEQARKI